MERLHKKKDFEVVFEKGKKFFSPYFSAFILKQNSLSVRVGIVVGKKVSKKAVVRNHVRRRIREAVRTLGKENQPHRGMDVAILPKIAALDAPFEELKKAVTKLLTFNF